MWKIDKTCSQIQGLDEKHQSCIGVVPHTLEVADDQNKVQRAEEHSHTDEQVRDQVDRR